MTRYIRISDIANQLGLHPGTLRNRLIKLGVYIVKGKIDVRDLDKLKEAYNLNTDVRGNV